MSVSDLPNILLIIADDLGRDVVRIVGSGGARKMQVVTLGDDHEFVGEMPSTSRILQAGLYFRQTWAQPVCSPTRASIFTGTHPWRNGIGNPGSPQLSASAVRTLPLILPEDYACGLFGKWHLGDLRSTRPTAHGWDKHVGTLGGKVPNYWSWTKDDSCNYLSPESNSHYVTEDTVEEAAAWINSLNPTNDPPWFVTIAFHAPHDPFHAPAGGTFDIDPWIPSDDPAFTFNAMAQNMDFNIGRLIGAGNEPAIVPIPKEQLENTIVIFIGDNGSHEDVAIEEGKQTIYEGGVNVPMILADGSVLMQQLHGEPVVPRFVAPDKINRGTPRLAHVVDIYQTILTLAEAEVEGADEDIDSRDLGPLFRNSGPQPEVRAYNFSQAFNERRGEVGATIRNLGYKLNYDITGDPVYSLFRYVGVEVPGSETEGHDVELVAEDIFAAAIDGTDADAQDALADLFEELSTHYQPIPTDDFPALESAS